jgi:hypothetical protein
MKIESVPRPVRRVGKLGILAAAALCAAALAQAQESSNLKLRDLQAKGAKQLSVAEVQEIVPGAKVTSVSVKGVTRRWSNDADGKFVASGFDPTTTTPKMRSFQGTGTWRIGDNGKYCVTVEWPRTTEQWCRPLFKLDDKYYAVKSADDENADAYELEFRK